MAFVKAKCTKCGANISVDDGKEGYFCPFCNAEIVTENCIDYFAEGNRVCEVDCAAENSNTTDNCAIEEKSVASKTAVGDDFVCERSNFEVDEFEIVDGVLKRYNGESATVAVPEGVVKIDKNAFKAVFVSEIRFPSTLKALEKLALEACVNKVDLGDGLERVNGEILNCFFLDKLHIGKNLIEFFGDCSFFARLSGITISKENKWCKIENGCLICGKYSPEAGRSVPYGKVVATVNNAGGDIDVTDVPYIAPKAFALARRLCMSSDHRICFEGAGLNSRFLEYVYLDAKNIQVINDGDYAFTLDGGNVKIVFGLNVERVSGNLFNLGWANKIEIVVQSDILCDNPPIKIGTAISYTKVVIGKNVTVFNGSFMGDARIDSLIFEPDCSVKTIENIVISQKEIELPDSVEKFSFIPVGDSEEYTLVVGETLYNNLKRVRSPKIMGEATVKLRGTNKQRRVNGFRLF